MIDAFWQTLPISGAEREYEKEKREGNSEISIHVDVYFRVEQTIKRRFISRIGPFVFLRPFLFSFDQDYSYRQLFRSP